MSISNSLQKGFSRTGGKYLLLYPPHHLSYIVPLLLSIHLLESASHFHSLGWFDEVHAFPGSGTIPHPSAVRIRQGIHHILSVPKQWEHGVSFQTEDYGIPASEIRFIQECKTEKACKALGSVIHLATVIHIVCRITIAEAVGDYINGKPINRIKYALN